MIAIELHNNNLTGFSDGTLYSVINDRALQYPHEAKERLDREFNARPDLVRGYFLEQGEPIAAWYSWNRTIRCIGHSTFFDGPKNANEYTDKDTMLIVAEKRNRASFTSAEGLAWARKQLVGATATAIAYDDKGIIAAWERGRAKNSAPAIVVRGPGALRR